MKNNAELISLVTIFFLFFSYQMILAHEGENDTASADTFTVVSGDTIAVNGEAIHGGHQDGEENKNVQENSKSYNPTISGILTEHIHNKVIHFPIAFSIAAFILTLVGFKEHKYEKGIKWLVVLAGIMGIIAVLSGSAQEESFEGTAKNWVVEVHQTFGIITLITIWLWVVFLYVQKLKKYAWIIGAILTLLVIITGAYGGMLAHG